MLQKAGFFLVMLAFISCTKVVQDKEDPVLTDFLLNTDKLNPGDILEVEVTGTDNENLSQLRIRVEEAFTKSDFGFWYILSIDEISGTSASRTLSFTVPDSALAGYYEVAVQLSDLRGNGSIDSIQYISIGQDGFMPELINFQTKPEFNENGLITLDFEDTLSFSGMAIDDTTLSTVEISILSSTGLSILDLDYNLNDSTNTWDFGLYADSVIANFGENNPDQLLIKITDSMGHLLRESYQIEYRP